jgi:phosphoribosylamine--glycine ligase
VRVLLVGAGGREHALGWKLAQSPLVDALICAPGNPGIAEVAELRPVAATDIAGLVSLVRGEHIDLAVVGPEAPLVAGLADALRGAGVLVFGPGASGARLEGSKAWAKSLMAAARIPTAAAASFDRTAEAIAFAERLGSVVVKADGLAAGKGVTVCEDLAQAREAITDALQRRVFGDAGARVVIEERLVGEELSVLAFCDGASVLAMDAAQDFKRAGDGDTGPNTGGMGSHSPVPAFTAELSGRVTDEVLEPIAAALASPELTGHAEAYTGMIYAGIMLTDQGPRVLEFNCRFGDPETQALLPRLSSDLAEPILASTAGDLAGVRLAFRPEACVAVVAASAGYPGPPQTGFPVHGLAAAASVTGLPVFQAGTARGPDGEVLTAGGRVLAVTAMGADSETARLLAYDGLREISFEGMWARSDIAAGVRHPASPRSAQQVPGPDRASRGDGPGRSGQA